MLTELFDLEKLNALKDLFYKEKDGRVKESRVWFTCYLNSFV
jgi:hypothetical protein